MYAEAKSHERKIEIETESSDKLTGSPFDAA